jgi:hypothetical protein
VEGRNDRKEAHGHEGNGVQGHQCNRHDRSEANGCGAKRRAGGREGRNKMDSHREAVLQALGLTPLRPPLSRGQTDASHGGGVALRDASGEASQPSTRG